MWELLFLENYSHFLYAEFHVKIEYQILASNQGFDSKFKIF